MDESNSEEKEYLSPEGFKKLKEELLHLKEVRRKEVAERLEYAKSLGDLSENAEYQEAKDDQLNCEARIFELENILNRAVLISHHAGQFVELGSAVVVQKEGNSNGEQYTIVGSEEADLAAKKISNESPLGRALIGKKRGEAVSVYTPKGIMRYHIIDVA